MNDGTTKVFFNTAGTKGRINKDAKNILEFIECGAAGDSFTEKLAQEVIKIKENKEWQAEYMTLMMREREKYNEGKNAGIQEGMQKGMQKGMVYAHYEMDMDTGEIASKVHLTEAEVLDIIRKK